jgi:hypothetical protein
MAKDPAVLFYTADFLTGTAFFTDEQRGQYIRLLCEQHQNGHIPEQHMIEICKSRDSVVMKKFKKDSSGNYFNIRMEDEKERRVKYSESRSKNRLSGNTKETYDTTYDNHMIQHMDTATETDTINDTESKNKVSKKFKIPELSEVIEYFKLNGFGEQFARKAFEYYNVAGWKDSRGKNVLNWKQKMQSVWFKDENKESKKDRPYWERLP